MSVRSGQPLFAFEPDLTIVSWNQAAEELTGVSADDAVGRFCWEVLGGCDDGGLVCHRACSIARLAREGRPVSDHCLLIKARDGNRRVDLSTVAIDDGGRRLLLHILRPHDARFQSAPEILTLRQHEVLRLLAEGIPAKAIATRLGLAEATVRNHIRAILVALGAHSQLEAIAKARLLQLVE